MKKYSDEVRAQALELFQHDRSQNEVCTRTNVPVETLAAWTADWRKEGLLVAHNRSGMEFIRQAKLASHGYYKCIRKRFNGMKWFDKLEGREFGFKHSVEAIHYYVDESGVPRVCAYCGRVPPEGKVWGLDRIDSVLGHIPGNLLPCCSGHPESSKLACQQSKSKFSLFNWLEVNLSRAYGKPVPALLVEQRVSELKELADQLAAFGQEKE
jgi:transposase